MAAILLGFVVYALRLFSLQVLDYASWMDKAEEQRISQLNLPTQRGIIYDRNNVILGRNIPSYNAIIIPADLPDDPGEQQEIFRQLSALIDTPVNLGIIDSATSPFVACKSKHGIAQIAAWAASYKPFTPVPIKCDIDRRTAMRIKERAVDWPGVDVEITPVRDYPTGVFTSNIIGYLGPIYPEIEEEMRGLGFDPSRDKIGYAGIELEYQDLLGGRNGQRVVEVDVGGQVLRDMAAPAAAAPGNNIRLTIDYRLQEAAYAILVDQINFFNARVQTQDAIMTSGVVIAINPQNGEILAMVSYPSYENNRLAQVIPGDYYEQLAADATLPLLNHAVSDQVPVGSVFKIVTGVGALNEAVVTPEQIIKTPGFIQLTEKAYANDPGRPKDFVDWINRDGSHPEGLGQLDFIHGLAFSSNVYFYKLGGGYQDEVPEGLGICRLGAYARALGYATPPEVQLPAVADGLIPDPDWKRLDQGQSWTTGDTYIASVGQGLVTATPLQVLLSAATVSMGGKLMEPSIVHEILDADGNVLETYAPRLRWDLTITPTIPIFDTTSLRDCEPTGELKAIQPWVFEKVREGMRAAVTEGTLGPLSNDAPGFYVLEARGIPAAGKTGTAEYCDIYATAKGRCVPGKWPAHAWTVAFAPYDKPEIAVVAFVYNGSEGASVAAPIVRRVLQTYFEIKAGDADLGR